MNFRITSKVKKNIFFFTLLISFFEFSTRFIIGIGDPILFKAHPSIEYEQLPNQKLRIFHNDIFINSLGMKSDEFDILKNKNKKRILVYGDSVIFGGNLISNRNLATSILQRNLNKDENLFEVANISSGSWGPGNWLAHLRLRGIYDADHVLLVINSNDFYDVPEYLSIEKNNIFPKKKPFSASLYTLQRYIIPRISSLKKRLFRKLFKNNFDNKASKEIKNKFKESLPKENSKQDLLDILAILENKNVGISVIQFWDKNEYINEKAREENIVMRKLFKKKEINTLQSLPYFKECSSDPNELYIDNIHPYKLRGQECLAKVMKKSLEKNKSLNIPNF